MSSIAIVITYNPENERLRDALFSLENNNLHILVIDNSLADHISNEISNICSAFKNCTYVPLNENTGIANAQNKGIAIALENGYKNIILSDQDTIYPNNFLHDMLKELEELQKKGERVAAIGPAYWDKNKPNIKPSFEIYKSGSIKKIFKENGTIKVSQLIASGMLIPTATIKEIGGMASELFIDWVDLEWCWRAINAGYSVHGTFNIKIDHQLGDKSKTILGKSISIHSPFRNYFIIRNGIHLAIRGHLLDSNKHRWYLFKRVIRYFLGMSLLSDNRNQDIRMMLRGFADGIRGKLGPLQ